VLGEGLGVIEVQTTQRVARPFAESKRVFLENANEQNLDRLALELGPPAG